MKDFSKINVLLGENNCGKTSVLESIFLLSGMSNPELALNINHMRGMAVNKNILKYIFYNLELANHPLIIGDFSHNINRKVEISPIFAKNGLKKDIKTSTRGNVSITSIPEIPDVLGLAYSYAIKKNSEPEKTFKTWFRIENEGIQQPLHSTYQEDIVSTFLFPGIIDSGLSAQLKTLFVTKKEHILNNLLHEFDMKIKGFYVLPDGIYIDKDGLPERIPLHLMGDGFRRFLNVVATIAANDKENFICLIDEIENGLHYKSQELMWQALFTLSHSANIQLFITTHSWEILQTLINVLKQKAYRDMQDSVKVFSIVHTITKGIQSYVRTHDGLDLALENLMEIR